MFVFSIFGTICLAVEFLNLAFELLSETCCPVQKWHHFNKILDPVTLCLSVLVVEEFPLAVLRWVTRDITEKPVGFFGYATGIAGMISPPARVVLVIIKCCCCDDNSNPNSNSNSNLNSNGSEKCCVKCCCCCGIKKRCKDCCEDKRKPYCECKKCGKCGKWKVGFIALFGGCVLLFNILNWVNVPPPGIHFCRWTYIEVIFVKYLTRSILLLPLHHTTYILSRSIYKYPFYRSDFIDALDLVFITSFYDVFSCIRVYVLYVFVYVYM